jgi:hypothetical protein
MGSDPSMMETSKMNGRLLMLALAASALAVPAMAQAATPVPVPATTPPPAAAAAPVVAVPAPHTHALHPHIAHYHTATGRVHYMPQHATNTGHHYVHATAHGPSADNSADMLNSQELSKLNAAPAK